MATVSKDDVNAQIEAAVAKFKEYAVDVNDEVAQAILWSALKVEGDAKREITDLGAVDTGRLRGSITHRMVDKTSAEVGTNVEYGPMVEWGTSKMAPRPFLTGAFEKNKKIIQDKIKEAMKRAESEAAK